MNAAPLLVPQESTSASSLNGSLHARDSTSLLLPTEEGRVDSSRQELDGEPAAPSPPNAFMEAIRPWLFLPENRKHWIVFCCFWIPCLGGIAYLFIWAFPRIVDVILPIIDEIKATCSDVQIGVLIIVGSTLFHLVFLPRLPWGILAALCFNFGIALLLIEIGQVFLSAISFWLAKTYFRDFAQKLMHRYKSTQALLMVAKDIGPWRLIIIIYLSPIYTAVSQYIIAIPREVTFWPALGASMIGVLPDNVIMVLFGMNVKGLAALFRGDFSMPPAQLAVNIISLASMIILIVGMGWYGKRAMKKLEEDARVATLARQEAEATVAEVRDGDPLPLTVTSGAMSVAPTPTSTSGKNASVNGWVVDIEAGSINTKSKPTVQTQEERPLASAPSGLSPTGLIEGSQGVTNRSNLSSRGRSAQPSVLDFEVTSIESLDSESPLPGSPLIK